MAQEHPLKRYKTYPKTLIGNRVARFRDAKGRWTAFKPGKLLTLVLSPKAAPVGSGRPSRPVKRAGHKTQVTRHKAKPQKERKSPTPTPTPTRKAGRVARKRQKSAKPAAKSPVLRKKRPTLLGKVTKKPIPKRKPVKPVKRKPAKPVKPVKRKAPAKPGVRKVTALPPKPPKPVKKKPVAGKGPWYKTDEVLDRLEQQYEGLIYKDVSEFKGEYYDGRGVYNRTIWASREIRPQMPIKSLFVFAVYSSPTYEGKKRTGAPEFIFVGKHIGWKTTPEWVLTELAKPGQRELMPDMTRQERTKLENLLQKIFLGCGDLEEFVGIRFSMKKPPEYRPNPKKKKRKK